MRLNLLPLAVKAQASLAFARLTAAFTFTLSPRYITTLVYINKAEGFRCTVQCIGNYFSPPAATLSLGGYTHKEIAKQMGITPAQAEAHLGKARYVLGHVWDS